MSIDSQKQQPLTCPCCGAAYASATKVQGSKWRRSAGFNCRCEVQGRCLACGLCQAHCGHDGGPVRDPRRVGV